MICEGFRVRVGEAVCHVIKYHSNIVVIFRAFFSRISENFLRGWNLDVAFGVNSASILLILQFCLVTRLIDQLAFAKSFHKVLHKLFLRNVL